MKHKQLRITIGALLIIAILVVTIAMYLPFAAQHRYTSQVINGHISGYEEIDGKLIVTVDNGNQKTRCQLTVETVYDMQCHIIFDKRLTDIPIYVITTNYWLPDVNRSEDYLYTIKNVGLQFDSAWDQLLQDGIVTSEDIAKYATQTVKGGK